jgi:hypothetical protein
MKRWLLLGLLPSLGCLSGGVQTSRPVGSDYQPAPAYSEPPPQAPPQPQYDPSAQPPPVDPQYDTSAQPQDDADLPPPQPPPDDVEVEAPQEPDTAEAVYEDPSYDDAPVVSVQYAPPPMRYEPPPPMPAESMAWVGGYWIWGGQGEWVWMTGHWTTVRPGYYWVPPYYENRGGGVIFVSGHFLREGVYFRPPPPAYRMVYVSVRPGYRGYPPPRDYRGCFVPPPPGSRYGLIVPAPIGTAPQVVVSQPPVVRSGMVIRGASGRGSVTVYAPAGVTRGGAVVRSGVPGRPDYAASLPPRVMVAPPRPPERVLAQHQGAVSPYYVRPVAPGQRYVLPPAARQAYQRQVQLHEERRVGQPPQRQQPVVQPSRPPAQPQVQPRPQEQRPVFNQQPRPPPPQPQAQPRPVQPQPPQQQRPAVNQPPPNRPQPVVRQPPPRPQPPPPQKPKPPPQKKKDEHEK